MKFVILFLILIVIFAVSITLGANNNQSIVFNYLLAQDELKLSTLLAIVFGSGFILSWFLTTFLYIRIKLKLTTAQRKLRKVQKMYDEEVANRQQNELSPAIINTNK